MSRFLSRIGALLKPVERANKRFWHFVLRQFWHNEKLEHRLDPARVRRVLFLRYDAIGDMLTTMPTFALLKRLNPAIEVDVMASPRNRRVIEHDPNVSHIFTLENGPLRFARTILAARRRRYDVIYCCIFGRGTKVGIVANWIGTRRAVKATVWRDERYWLYFNVQSRNAMRPRCAWEQVIGLVGDTLDATITDDQIVPYIAPGESSTQAALARLTALGHIPGEYLLVNLSASHERNLWGGEKYEQLVASLAEAMPELPMLLIAMPGDRDTAERIAARHSASGNVAVYPPASDLLEVIAVVANSRAVFTPDTGVVHMASASGRPVAAMYVGGDAVLDWRPYKVPTRIITAGQDVPVRAITVEQARDGVLDLLREIAER